MPFTVDQVDPLVLVIADGDLNQIKATLPVDQDI
jgi:hypothetical protein